MVYNCRQVIRLAGRSSSVREQEKGGGAGSLLHLVGQCGPQGNQVCALQRSVCH